jgi:hypothetical protein
MKNIHQPLLAGVAAACLLLGGTAVHAAQEGEDSIEADRPGMAESSSVVGTGHVQLEMGLQQEYSRGNGTRERTLIVPTLVRIGVTDKLEVRIEGDTYTRMHETPPGGPGARSEGMAPTSIGAKMRLREAEGSEGASTAAILRYTPRSGSGNFKSTHATGDLRFVADWELASKWSLNPNIGVGLYEDDAQRRYTSALVAATLGYDASKALNLFIDTGMQYPESKGGGLGAIIDVGASYLIGRNLRLDLSAGSRLAGTTYPRTFVSVGFSQRF